MHFYGDAVSRKSIPYDVSSQGYILSDAELYANRIGNVDLRVNLFMAFMVF
jgi:hypothetical protein